MRCVRFVGRRAAKTFKLVKHDKKLVRFYLPLEPKKPEDPTWSVIRTLSDKIGEQLTTHLRAIADANPPLKRIIDRIDFNATTHGVRDLEDYRLSNLIERISKKRLGLGDVEPDIIGRSYEYLIRKFTVDSVSSLLDTVGQKIKLACRRRPLLAELFQTLSHQLVTVQIRVNDLDVDGFFTGANAERTSYPTRVEVP